jgi:hypothetical protein
MTSSVIAALLKNASKNVKTNTETLLPRSNLLFPEPSVDDSKLKKEKP